MPKANTLTIAEFEKVVRKTDQGSKDAVLLAIFALSGKDRPDLIRECLDALTEEEED